MPPPRSAGKRVQINAPAAQQAPPNPFAASAAAAPANPFAPTVNTGAPAANPFAPAAATPAANPFAPAAAPAANPFAAAAAAGAAPAANPFAAAAAPAANPFAPAPAANPFAAAGGAAAANPFAPGAAAAARNPFAPAAAAPGVNPFAPAGAAAAYAPAGAAPPAAFADAQDQKIHEILSIVEQFKAVLPSSASSQVVELLLPYFKNGTYDNFAFKRIAYNARNPSAAPSAHLTADEWDTELRERGVDEECNPPMKIMPVALVGFDALRERHEEQAATVTEIQREVEPIMVHVQRLAADTIKSRDRLENIRRQHMLLSQRLLSVAGKVERAIARGVHDLLPDEAQLHTALFQLKRYIQEEAHIRERLERLAWLRHARREAAAAASAYGMSGAALDPADVDTLLSQLQAQEDAVASVAGVLRKDVRDLAIIKATLQRAVQAQEEEAHRIQAKRAMEYPYGVPL